MINLIKNELTKISKKKSIYITLAITLVFIIACNIIYKVNSNSYSGYDLASNIEYYETQLDSLDVNDAQQKDMYINYEIELELAKLIDKYGDSNTWQADVIYSYGRNYIEDKIYAKYAETEPENMEQLDKEYQEFVAKLDSGDWQYFAKQELSRVNENIEAQKKMKESVQDSATIEAIESQIYSLEIDKQKLEWRLEKDIPYGYDYFNQCLDLYGMAKLAIRDYENSSAQHKEEYSAKQEYYANLEQAALNQYDIENKTTSGLDTDARGLLLDSFGQFELFIIIMIIMVAGTIVSEEFNKGTIKLLLIKPYKRTVILTSKFITCIIMLVIIIVLVLLMQFIAGGIIQGFDQFSTPAVVYNHTTNEVQEVNIISYLAMQALGKLGIYIPLMTLAFALSTIFTNSALAITIALLGYMGAPFVTQIGLVFNLDWLRYFITPNWDFTQFFFGNLPAYEGLTPIFSIAIVAIYMIIMLIPTFVIFKKKNIKNI